MATNDVNMDPAAVEQSASKLRSTASTIAQHGNDLDVATSGRRVGRGGAIGTAVENLVKRGLSTVARDATQAVKRLHDDTATGLERAAKRVRTQDTGAKNSFDSLGKDPYNLPSGSAIPLKGAGGSRGGSPSPVPEVKPPHSPDVPKWQKAGGTVEYHKNGSVTYTSGTGHVGKGVPLGTTVTYDKRGNPNFNAFLTHPSGVTHVTFPPAGYSGNRGSDFTQSNHLAKQKADELAKENAKLDAANQKDLAPWTTTGAKSPTDYTWHHHHDLVTMQLVARNIHQNFSHLGGVSLLGLKKKK
jgi:DNase/tRNase domain of colicin-like bacteriocin